MQEFLSGKIAEKTAFYGRKNRKNGIFQKFIYRKNGLIKPKNSILSGGGEI
ncbi:MAG: hypothetical protein IJ945_09665 [Oscillospiraceae bacterium]|nr:hypothetical protein [Oscillospiraceae bacterium]